MNTETRRVALVTGASRGIGKAVALELGRQGMTVVGTATTDKGAQDISNYLADNTIKGAGLRLDVASTESVTSVLEAIEQQYGTPLVVVNNVGITKDNLLMRMKAEEWSDVIETNLNALYRICRLTLKGMTKARWGRIINISSVVASSGNPGQTNYAAAKAGMEGFSRSLAKEVGSRNITVNCVAPGFIETDMTQDLPEAQRQAMLDMTALKRLGQPEEIAGVVAFLASDAAAYITGEVIQVNGGLYMQ